MSLALNSSRVSVYRGTVCCTTLLHGTGHSMLVHSNSQNLEAECFCVSAMAGSPEQRCMLVLG